MALHLTSPVGALPGLGEKAVNDLKNLGLTRIRDLLMYLPFRYEDYSQVRPIGELAAGDTVTVEGAVRSIHTRPSQKNRRLKLTEAVVEDATGSIKVIWFNQPYLEKTLKPGTKLSLAGLVDAKYGLSMVSPVHEPAGKRVHTGRIVPVYGLTGSLTMRRLRGAIESALGAADELAEWLPDRLVEAEGFPSFATAVRQVHFPDDRVSLDAALARMKFDELFLYQLMFTRVREDRQRKRAVGVPVREDALKSFVDTLAFPLTADQKRAAWEVVQDMAEPRPMNRLLEGDVGSGKTAVAAIAAAHTLAAEQGSVAYLAPTEILAAQQQAGFADMLAHDVALVTSSQARIGGEDARREDILARLKDGTLRCVVGTHALLQQGIAFPDLRLVIIDEQHRFGVEQRHAILEAHDPAPHLLSMTATPIPRSLSLTLYGDLDLSLLKQKPPGRKAVAAKLVREAEEQGMWQHVREQVEAGRQAYVVCPLIDPSDALGSASVNEVAAKLEKSALKGLRIAVLHGKLKSDEKAKTVAAFAAGELDILVSTTVVEVGVNVPNASVMVIMGAERFGLAQLHQLRGRVGRAEHQSYCYLLADELSKNGEERLRAFEATSDGFALAELDLEMRGPGSVFGTAQSGLPEFKLATLADADLMKRARDRAEEFSDTDAYPELKKTLQERLDRVHLE